MAHDAVNCPAGNGGARSATKTCMDGSNYGQKRTFYISRATRSLSRIAEVFWNVGRDWTVGEETGPAVYFGPWCSIYVADEYGLFGPAGSVQQVSHRIVLHLGVVAGLSESKCSFILRHNYLYAPPHYTTDGSDVPSGVRAVHMLTVNCAFLISRIQHGAPERMIEVGLL